MSPVPNATTTLFVEPNLIILNGIIRLPPEGAIAEIVGKVTVISALVVSTIIVLAVVGTVALIVV